MKIKTFRFKILSSCIDNNEHLRKQNKHDEYNSLYTNEKIDQEINQFIQDKIIQDIKINEIYQSNTEHNGTNIVLLQYTIIYKEDTI